MFNSWVITKEFTPNYTVKVNAAQPVVRLDELAEKQFVADSVSLWPQVKVDMRKYWGSVRDSDLYGKRPFLGRP